MDDTCTLYYVVSRKRAKAVLLKVLDGKARLSTVIAPGDERSSYRLVTEPYGYVAKFAQPVHIEGAVLNKNTQMSGVRMVRFPLPFSIDTSAVIERLSWVSPITISAQPLISDGAIWFPKHGWHVRADTGAKKRMVVGHLSLFVTRTSWEQRVRETWTC